MSVYFNSDGTLKVELVVGPVLVGCMLGSFLAGTVLVQAATFFNRFPKERWLLTVLVACLSVLSLANWIADIPLLWHYTLDFRDPHQSFGLLQPPLQQRFQYISPTFAAFLSHVYFFDRCWRFLGRRIIPGIIMGVFCLLALAFGLASFATVGTNNDLANQSKHDRELGTLLTQLWLWFTASADLLIASILVWSLASQRTGVYEKTDRILVKVIRVVLTTSLFTTILTITDSILLVASDLFIYHISFFLLLPHAYAISVVYTLNARMKIKFELGSSGSVTTGQIRTQPSSKAELPFPLRRLQGSAGSNSHKADRNKTWQTTEEIHVTVNRMADEEEEGFGKPA
ncbi:hypothetical protein BT69DRAFT_1322653 [Atractiella rhizophila]|nr:hypothetical protein BT69DRAFT_1322653 [Atractiella rhizophila]